MNKVKAFIKNNKDIIICTLIAMIVCLFLFLVYYPGIMTYDGNNQWKQVQTGVINNAHPIFSTFFMLLLSKIHNTTTIVILFQILAFSVTWGLLVREIRVKNEKQNIIKYIYTFIMCFIPIIGIYIISLWKDILYSIYLLGLGGIILYGINHNFKYKNYHYVLTGILLTLIASYRHNGIIVAILMLMIIGIGLLVKRKTITKKTVKKYSLVFLVFIIAMLLIAIPKKIYTDKTNKEVKTNQLERKISLKNKYILWMIQAELKEGKIKNKKDLKFLSNITNLDKFKDNYNPYIINDLVYKNDLNANFINKNEDKILDILIKYAGKNPEVIIDHVIRRDALLINPVSKNITYVYVYSFSEWDYLGFDKLTPKTKFKFFRDNIYDRVINLSFKGILKYFYQPALILYISIIMLIILSIKVYGKSIHLLGLPMYLNTISLLPINLAQDLRYVYINYLIFFVILLIFIINFKEIIKRDKKAKKSK
ncbi:MAG: hypothetical protein IJI43_04090 [Bacilli bacterium]|nr:hypothetical protein [Bacilli bacterium]